MLIKFLISLILSQLVISQGFTQNISGPHGSPAPLNICTADMVTCAYPYKIIVSSGTLTDNGDGTVTLATGGSGASAYATIKDEGVTLTQRTVLKFVGAGITCIDSGGETVCTIPGGGPAPTNNLTFLGINLTFGASQLTFTP